MKSSTQDLSLYHSRHLKDVAEDYSSQHDSVLKNKKTKTKTKTRNHNFIFLLQHIQFLQKIKYQFCAEKTKILVGKNQNAHRKSEGKYKFQDKKKRTKSQKSHKRIYTKENPPPPPPQIKKSNILCDLTTKSFHFIYWSIKWEMS